MSTVDELIQNLPLELQERVRKELISIKIIQRSALGWDEVHQELQEMIFCGECLLVHNIPFWFWDYMKSVFSDACFFRFKLAADF